MDTEAVLHQLMPLLVAELGPKADISLLPPTSHFRTSQIAVQPRRPGAADVRLLADNDALLMVCAGTSTFLVDARSADELVGKALSFVRHVAEGRLVHQFSGKRFRTATTGVEPDPDGGRLVRFFPY